jgi:hypothetical protein
MSTDATTISIDAPTDIDPQLAYMGVVAEPARSGNLALLGCIYDQSGAVAHWVVHEWAGDRAGGLVRRQLSSSPQCVAQSSIGGAPTAMPTFWRPLTDGTWILPSVSGSSSDSYSNAVAILMRP